MPFITNDAVTFGILVTLVALIFKTSSIKSPFWQKFYTFIPALFLCYFLPSLLNTFGIISSENSQLYFVASRYLLPASLVLFTISIDFKGIVNLGWKAVLMFAAATTGIIIGGPVAVYIVALFSPETVGGAGPDAIWRGLTTIAGSWIGGGANQAAMKEVFGVGDKVFSAMVTVDVFVSNFWMAFLLYGAGVNKKIDRWFKADASDIDVLKERIDSYRKKIARIPSLSDVMMLLAVGFGATAIAHFAADLITPWLAEIAPELKKYSLTSSFFWIVVVATTVGLGLSFTKLRTLEGAGASTFASAFLYLLVATIGMKMDILEIIQRPGLFFVAVIWMGVHISFLLLFGKLIKAPFFFTAVGSQANVGGAASAPIVAAAFHPSLAPVGILLAVLGYAVGTYGAYITGLLLQIVAP